jgi:hypothetical protein
MDTRFWGPSGWQLFHLVAHAYPDNPDPMTTRRTEMFLNSIKCVLPCRFCRESTTEFMKEPEHDLHTGMTNPARWLWKLHNRVNKKLRDQHKTDKNIILPEPDPSFESVKAKYEDLLSKKPTMIPGFDFLMAVAYNYPAKPDADFIQCHYDFYMTMYDVYPFPNLRKRLQAYMDKRVMYDALQSRSALLHWTYDLMKALGAPDLPSFRSLMNRYAYYKSGCSKKTYRGKTCRRLPNGKYTKDRDHTVTRKVSHALLLQ